MIDTSELRRRLVDMRAALVERLAKRMDGGDLALLGSIGAALATLEQFERNHRQIDAADDRPQDHGERPVERSPSLRRPRSVEPGPRGEGQPQPRRAAKVAGPGPHRTTGS
jgi:hypothetical protein